MKIQITAETTATFKHEDTIGGQLVGPVIVYRDAAARAAANKGREWIKDPETGEVGPEPWPEGVYELGWIGLDEATDNLTPYGIEIEEV